MEKEGAPVATRTRRRSAAPVKAVLPSTLQVSKQHPNPVFWHKGPARSTRSQLKERAPIATRTRRRSAAPTPIQAVLPPQRSKQQRNPGQPKTVKNTRNQPKNKTKPAPNPAPRTSGKPTRAQKNSLKSKGKPTPCVDDARAAKTGKAVKIAVVLKPEKNTGGSANGKAVAPQGKIKDKLSQKPKNAKKTVVRPDSDDSNPSNTELDQRIQNQTPSSTARTPQNMIETPSAGEDPSSEERTVVRADSDDSNPSNTELDQRIQNQTPSSTAKTPQNMIETPSAGEDPSSEEPTPSVQFKDMSDNDSQQKMRTAKSPSILDRSPKLLPSQKKSKATTTTMTTGRHFLTQQRSGFNSNIASRTFFSSESLPQHSKEFMVKKDVFAQRYAIPSDPIGIGTYSEVFAIFDLTSGEQFALKRIPKNSDTAKQIQRELTMVMKLDHSNVLQMMEWYEDPQHVFIRMEIAGNDLESVLQKEGRFSDQTSATYTKQLFKGLDYMHGNDFVHGDVSPANILVGQDGQLKLCDFGATKLFEAMDESFGGTEGYLAPEICRKQISDPTKWDCYAAGAVSYRMVTGFIPKKKTHKLLLGNVFVREHRFLSEDARRFLAWILLPSAETRPSANQAVEQYSWLHDAPEAVADPSSREMSTLESNDESHASKPESGSGRDGSSEAAKPPSEDNTPINHGREYSGKSASPQDRSIEEFGEGEQTLVYDASESELSSD